MKSDLQKQLAESKATIKAFSLQIQRLEKENRKLKEENEYLYNMLPEWDGYIIEKAQEKKKPIQRLWNDWEEDVYI